MIFIVIFYNSKFLGIYNENNTIISEKINRIKSILNS